MIRIKKRQNKDFLIPPGKDQTIEILLIFRIIEGLSCFSIIYRAQCVHQRFDGGVNDDFIQK